MKKFHKIIFIILLFQVYNLISCDFCDCPVITCADIVSFSVDNIDNSGETPVFQQNDSITAIAYAVKLNFLTVEQICKEYNYNLSFSKKLYACSCNVPHLINYIEKITVLSTKDFNSDYPAGTELNELFSNVYNNLDSEILDKRDIYSYLDKIPDTVEERKFIVNILLKDGTLFSDTTENVILTR